MCGRARRARPAPAAGGRGVRGGRAAERGSAARSEVVAYDEAGEGGAARLWWLLRHFGHEAVAVLDGGLAGWRAAGGPLEGVRRIRAPVEQT